MRETLLSAASHFGLVFLASQIVFALGFATTMTLSWQLDLAEGDPAETVLQQFGEGLLVGLIFGLLGAVALATLSTANQYVRGSL